VRQLIEHQSFYSIRESLERSAASFTRTRKPILILSPPTLKGALSIAPLEASLIDENIPYRRRFSTEKPQSSRFIKIVDAPEIDNGGIVDYSETTISPLTVEGLKGRKGDSRKGTLSTVAQAHALAQIISPSSQRLRRMRPWVLSGNWIDGALDTTYDPVYTSLRDFLSEEGSINVVPLTEVPNPEKGNYYWIEEGELARISKIWNSFDMNQKEMAMDSLAEPAIVRKTPTTARLEELIWHCIIGVDWQTDLASQIFKLSDLWGESDHRKSASDIVDLLISKGNC
jgi:hypothetical protein